MQQQPSTATINTLEKYEERNKRKKERKKSREELIGLLQRVKMLLPDDKR